MEETWQLPLAMPSSEVLTRQIYTLPDLMAHYARVETVSVECCQGGRNTYHDSRLLYVQTPPVLVVQALRFFFPEAPSRATIIDTESSAVTNSPTEYLSGRILPKRKRQSGNRKVIKNVARIEFPLTGLDMASYLPTQSTGEEVYDLFAIVEHVGKGMDGGHYVAYVRAKASSRTDCWWKCDDEKCWMVCEELVSAAEGYIWFYERHSQSGESP